MQIIDLPAQNQELIHQAASLLQGQGKPDIIMAKRVGDLY